MKIATFVCIAAALFAGVACDKKEGGSAAAPSASASAAKATESSGKQPTTKLTEKDLDAAYKAVTKNLSEPKKVEIATEKLGAPQRTEGKKAYWYAWVPKDGAQAAKCVELEVEPNGAQSMARSADKCGM